MNAFWPWQKQNSDFQFLAFPIGYVGGLRWRWGLKTNFKIFLKGIFVQEEHVLTMANLKYKVCLHVLVQDAVYPISYLIVHICWEQSITAMDTVQSTPFDPSCTPP